MDTESADLLYPALDAISGNKSLPNPEKPKASMVSSVPYYRLYLQSELTRRCRKNPRYSLRAFAGHLGMDPGAFSRILSGKRPLSPKLARRLADSLSLAPDDQLKFLNSVAQDRAWQGLQSLVGPAPCEETALELGHDTFQVIADVYHYAILELTFVEGFQDDCRWIGKQLGITAIEAQLALARLLRLGLLERVNGKLRKSNRLLTTKDRHVTTPALRRHQKQVLSGAMESLEKDAIDERDITSMTMAIDPDKLPLAKRLIAEFTRQICESLECGRQRRVYQLGVSLYPLQRKERPRHA
jgi:uncharacterized protein (TIGR02147 family)